MRTWIYKYEDDVGVVIAETLEAALDDLRFNDEHELHMAELKGVSHAALLVDEGGDPFLRWVSLSPDITRPELEFVTVKVR